jgi:AbrB family looped-hinge helix DNA binding protein
MNARTKLSSKGQLVIPKSVRDAHGWGEGTEFEIVDEGKGVRLQPIGGRDPLFPPITVEEFRSRIVKYNGPPVSIEDMDRAVLEDAKRRWDAENG